MLVSQLNHVLIDTFLLKVFFGPNNDYPNKHLLLLAEAASLVEVTEQNRKEQVQHDDGAKHEQNNVIDFYKYIINNN